MAIAKYLNITPSGAFNCIRFHGLLINPPEPNLQSVSVGGFANGIYDIAKPHNGRTNPRRPSVYSPPYSRAGG
jgi:hypothetical protein